MYNSNYINPKVNYVRTVIEPIVKRTLEARGDYVNASKQDDDFDGIDLIVHNRKHNKTTYIDVKSSTDKYKSTNRFSFTITSSNNKSYKDKVTDYIIYVDFPTNTLICVEYKKLIDFIDTTNLKVNTGNRGSKYVWLYKNEMRKIGSSIPIVN